MATIEIIPVSDLLLDESNARLPDPQPKTQQATALALVRLDPRSFVNLAEHIAANGTDPTTLPAVVATSDSRKRYRVMEGNRRVLALKALETPHLSSEHLTPPSRRPSSGHQLGSRRTPSIASHASYSRTLERRSHGSAFATLDLREEQVCGDGAPRRRTASTAHGLDRPAQNAREIVDFLDAAGVLGTRDQAAQRRILSNVVRLFSTPDVRHRLGIDWSTSGGVVSNFAAGETSPGAWGHREALRKRNASVGQIYNATDRRAFAAALSEDQLPDPAERISAPTHLRELQSVLQLRARSPPTRPIERIGRTSAHRQDAVERMSPLTTLIPRSCQLDIAPPRINAISLELQDLSIEKAPNACSVLFRVFIELSVDHYLITHKIMIESQMNRTQFGQKLKEVGGHLEQAGHIPAALRKVIDTVGNGRGPLASAFTMNQYVHNAHIIVNPRELREAWDEIEPSMEKVWP